MPKLPLKSDKPPAAIYALQAGPLCPRDAGISRERKLISVAPPQVPAGFDTNRIALYLMSGRRMDYFASAVWPSNLPEVMQDFIVSAAGHSCSGLIASGTP